MATPSVTPNPNGNPFDQPLNSEVNESQQNQAATVAASPNGNPFNEPLASEKAEAQHDTVMQHPHYDGSKMGSKVPNSILNAPDSLGDTIGGLTVAGGAALAASPIVDAAVAHLGSLTKIVQVAKNLGWTAFSLKEAHDLYKMVSGDKK